MAHGRLKLNASLQVNARVVERVKHRLDGKARQISTGQVLVGIDAKSGGERKINYKGREGRATLAQIAWWLEHGTDTVPERPFMRQWYDGNEARLKRELSAAVRAEFQGNKSALDHLGARWADELRETLLGNALGLAELATSTIAAKAAAGLDAPEIPLVATKQLVNAITSSVGRSR
jgi:hypothetical protein